MRRKMESARGERYCPDIVPLRGFSVQKKLSASQRGVLCGQADGQPDGFPQERGYGIPYLDQLLVLGSLEHEVVGEGLKAGHFAGGQHAGQPGVDVHAAMVLLDGTRGLVPRAFLPCVRISLVQALAFGQGSHPVGHVGAMTGGDVVEGRIVRMVHQVADGMSRGDIFVRGEQGFGIIDGFSHPVADKDDAFALLGDVVVGRAQQRDLHIVADGAEVSEDFLLHLAAEHAPETFHVLAEHIAGTQVLDDFEQLLVQGVAWVIDNAVAGHAESLAGESARHDVQPPAVELLPDGLVEFFLGLAGGDVAIYERVVEVTPIGHPRFLEPVQSAYSLQAGHLEAFAQAPCATEAVHKGHLRGGGVLPVLPDVCPREGFWPEGIGWPVLHGLSCGRAVARRFRLPVSLGDKSFEVCVRYLVRATLLGGGQLARRDVLADRFQG